MKHTIRSDGYWLLSPLQEKLIPVLLYPGLLLSLIQPISLLVACRLITSRLSGCLIRAGSLLHKRKPSFHTCTWQEPRQREREGKKKKRMQWLLDIYTRQRQTGRQDGRFILFCSKPLLKRQIFTNFKIKN